MQKNKVGRRNFTAFLQHISLQRGFAFGIIILMALVTFEVFNYSTTEFALSDLLGDLQFMGLRWATILAIAFCGIDFAGIVHLFTPEEGQGEIKEVWYLFGAWLLASTMNAMLTWWGISTAILGNQALGSAVLSRETLVRVVPIFVAVMVWLMRVLIIGTFSVAGERMFSQEELRTPGSGRAYSKNVGKPLPVRSQSVQARAPGGVEAEALEAYRPAPKPVNRGGPAVRHHDPTYHPLPVNASGPISRIHSRIVEP
ncbi:hypothetical protein ACFLV7_13740 [Chloroflexota bacterium]